MVGYFSVELFVSIFVAGLVLIYFLQKYDPLMTLIHRHSLAFDILVIFGSILVVLLFFRLIFPW
ncbi:MAG: hypothetical protein NTY03_04480 [Candidatus Bathyarchaeota archaeon]|nr:hypothetical protein [Candidatus Bathyarchaeota archaeon]